MNSMLDRWGYLPKTDGRPFEAYFAVADDPVRPVAVAVRLPDRWAVRLQPFPGINVGERHPSIFPVEEILRECEATLVESGMTLGEWRQPDDAEQLALFGQLVHFEG